MGFLTGRFWQQWLRQYGMARFRWRRSMIGIWVVFGLTAGWILSDSHQVIAQVRPSRAVYQTTESLVQQGIDRYEQEQFAAAIGHWQQAREILSQQEDGLTQAYVLNNLAQAYQKLSQWQTAQTALDDSIAQLNRLDDTAEQTDYLEIWAKVLNTQGQQQWHQSQPEQALASWQQAADLYQQAESAAGATTARLNQTQVLQELGLNGQSLQLLQQTYEDLQGLEPAFKSVGIRQLGVAYRLVGALARSQQILTESLDIASPSAQGQIYLELGNTARVRSHRAAATEQWQQAQTYGENALAYYQSAVESPGSELPRVQAQLNRVSYLIETGQLRSAAAQVAALQQQVLALTPSRSALVAQLNYAHSLTCLQPQTSCLRQEWQLAPATDRSFAVPPFENIARLLAITIQQAQQLRDVSLESYAVGALGHLYELTQQWSEAQALTQKALLLTEPQQQSDIAYRWEWQLGRIYRQQPEIKREQVVATYRRALKNLKTVRSNLVRVNADVQFSFLDNVEPIYREFLEILLSPGLAVNSTDLRLAIETLDNLQLTELENFLGCNLSRLVNISEVRVDPAAVKLYPVPLNDRLVVIYDIPDRPLAYYETSVARSEMETVLQNLRKNLTLPGKTPAVLTDANRVYQWLVAPFEPILAQHSQIETLVFVPDGVLRNIPMGVLYDGEQYLIEKDYAIAVAPQINLFQPRSTTELNIFRGGVSLPQEIRGTEFPPIDQVAKELDLIPDTFASSPPLLDETFTKSNIEQQLQSANFSAIHWKTHGVYSSDPGDTYLVAYRDSITANELNALLEPLGQQGPLELMVLSACATAQSDRRSVLGLAGVAVRAGARSTLSTLWRADDDATTRLMARFYQALLRPGMSKAKALQQAQLGLLREEGYPAPYYWSTYVLVGNWL